MRERLRFNISQLYIVQLSSGKSCESGSFEIGLVMNDFDEVFSRESFCENCDGVFAASYATLTGFVVDSDLHDVVINTLMCALEKFD